MVGVYKNCVKLVIFVGVEDSKAEVVSTSREHARTPYTKPCLANIQNRQAVTSDFCFCSNARIYLVRLQSSRARWKLLYEL